MSASVAFKTPNRAPFPVGLIMPSSKILLFQHLVPQKLDISIFRLVSRSTAIVIEGNGALIYHLIENNSESSLSFVTGLKSQCIETEIKSNLLLTLVHQWAQQL